ncbi:MAG TPA: protein kinase [Polyangiaceae bacterium]|nr:protein kinase [Polyangiaceae bacterium]
MHLQVSTSGEAVGGSRYRTLGRLGSGGMAEVDLALQTGVAGSSRLCVLKRVRRDLAGRQEFVSMFFEEARISASLNHPNIVQIYEVGGDERDCFLAMEFLRGRSYAHVQSVSAGKTLDYRVDLEVMLATLTGLEHAHQRRDLAGEPMHLVHRDISPPNLLVTYEGEIKLLDFGVAKAKNSLVKTEAGTLKGKVAYMAPEVVAGNPFDARADLYAVGVMLWEATAGHDRWPGLNDVAILGKLARGGEVPAPGAAARLLPGLADEICVKALAEDPDDRYQSAAEFRDAILELCGRLGGRLGQAELRDYMQRHFAADRQREEREIEAALRGDRAPSGESDEAAAGHTKRVKRPSERPAPGFENATPGVETDAPSLETTSPRRSGVALLAAAAVLLLLGAGLTRLLTSRVPAPVADTTDAAAKPPTAEVAVITVASTPAAPGEPPNQATPDQAKPAPVERARAAKPGAAPRSQPATAVSNKGKAPAERGLQLDRQDPWQE